MTLKSIYQSKIETEHFDTDSAQASVVDSLNQLHLELSKQNTYRSSFSYRLKKLTGSKQSTKGIYLWGGVGRGKTWLMDLFFFSLPFDGKLRLHFHHFMQAVHDELRLLKGHTNPLILVARNFAKNTSVICLDEFHVSDITDAMLLYGLLDELFKCGITLVMTSNLSPDDLYKNGLQRERFLPAIEFIKQNTQIINIDGEIDHRLRLLEKAETWYTPLSAENNDLFIKQFSELAPCKGEFNQPLQINYRTLYSKLHADDVIWFEFDMLCAGPRATADYIEIAKCFHTVFISNIPVMDESTDDKARRFINMIDEFYDRNVKLVASSEAHINNIYQGHELTFEFQRTISRLEEMRSHNYLSKAHKP
ncbi:MAG: cell division protein ZapE [Gammaproteobacteria bacterium]|nr:cell division protein ZapE [Gammaproteobacteria bacterium]MCW8909551.1 cell division protein ZapE [Gammaproteobacteria bacterium]MCW9003977.1 cell division protein ZapE [Gammaproteobacteria bacterium]MCW9055685.1 cell division protein ZapE [Gammaproteobacteria bacterium]